MAVYWLRLHPSTAGGMGWIPGQELRWYMHWGMTTITTYNKIGLLKQTNKHPPPPNLNSRTKMEETVSGILLELSG